jgi:type IV secretion system protein VirD4
MSLNAGAAAWQKPTRSVPGRAAKLALASAVALLAGQYLAGFLFLWSVHADVRSASPLTVARYGYYYGQHPAIRRRLWGSSAVGFILVGATLGVWLLPRRRALHGEARFATRREIAAAGLLGHEGIILGAWGRRCLMLAGQQEGDRCRGSQCAELARVPGLRRHQARELDADGRLPGAIRPGLLPL